MAGDGTGDRCRPGESAVTKYEEVLLVAENLRRSMGHYALTGSGGEIRDYPGLTVMFSGMRTLPFFNSAMLTQVVSNETELAQRVLMARTHFSMRGVPWTFWLTPEMLGETQGARRRVLETCGLRLAEQPLAMHAGELPSETTLLPDLDIEAITEPRLMMDFCSISSESFQLPMSTALRLYGVPAYWTPEVRGFVGYSSGRAVTTAVYVQSQRCLGVYSVATSPSVRRQGFAEALMRNTLTKMKQQTRLQDVVLQSTPHGLPLYLKLGFKPVSRFEVYVSE